MAVATTVPGTNDSGSVDMASEDVLPIVIAGGGCVGLWYVGTTLSLSFVLFTYPLLTPTAVSIELPPTPPTPFPT